MAGQSTRDNCYSLLHQLLATKMQEELAKHDPPINPDDLQLPPGETATRGAIACTKKKELL
jgi:hypothetical protein